MNAVAKAWYVLRHLGPGFVRTRVGMKWERLSGRPQRVFAPREWDALELAALCLPGTPTQPRAYADFKRRQAIPFLFPLGAPPAIPESWGETAPVARRAPDLAARVALLAQDRCVHLFRQVSPEPNDWSHNPFTGGRAELRKPWFDVPDFDPAASDVRAMWDPARAAWAWDLARAAAREPGRPEHTALLLRWWQSWTDACPPWRGVHWKCGQESSVRFIALASACWALAGDEQFDGACWVRLARLAWATGYRVHHHIAYAVSQKNNHALSEACGLLIVAHLFPELREARHWGETGRRVLARELRRQMYADGSYVQHSMNYHRVMMQVCTLALRLAELAGRPFERDLYEHLGRAAEFLYQMMQPENGALPNYGNNDGALVLPLSECDFADYRPAIQAGYYLATRKRRLPPGPWDEELLWLFGDEALAAPVADAARRSTAFDDGGYYTLDRGESWAMVRCHSYRDRPAHADPLHLDLWWGGVNVLRDAGSYLYFTREPAEERYYKSIRAHNTIELGACDPMELVSRFLYLPWLCATKRHFEADARCPLFEGEHHGYARGPAGALHRRCVVALSGRAWLVIDDVFARQPTDAVLRWHLPAGPVSDAPAAASVSVTTEAGVVGLALRAEVETQLRVIETGEARYYGTREPQNCLEMRFRAAGATRVWTIVSLGSAASATRDGCVAGGTRWTIDTLPVSRDAARVVMSAARG